MTPSTHHNRFHMPVGSNQTSNYDSFLLMSVDRRDSRDSGFLKNSLDGQPISENTKEDFKQFINKTIFYIKLRPQQRECKVRKKRREKQEEQIFIGQK